MKQKSKDLLMLPDENKTFSDEEIAFNSFIPLPDIYNSWHDNQDGWSDNFSLDEAAATFKSQFNEAESKIGASIDEFNKAINFLESNLESNIEQIPSVLVNTDSLTKIENTDKTSKPLMEINYQPELLTFPKAFHVIEPPNNHSMTNHYSSYSFFETKKSSLNPPNVTKSLLDEFSKKTLIPRNICEKAQLFPELEQRKQELKEQLKLSAGGSTVLVDSGTKSTAVIEGAFTREDFAWLYLCWETKERIFQHLGINKNHKITGNSNNGFPTIKEVMYIIDKLFIEKKCQPLLDDSQQSVENFFYNLRLHFDYDSKHTDESYAIHGDPLKNIEVLQSKSNLWASQKACGFFLNNLYRSNKPLLQTIFNRYEVPGIVKKLKVKSGSVSNNLMEMLRNLELTLVAEDGHFTKSLLKPSNTQFGPK